MAATATPWYKRRVPRSAHLASIPLSRLWMLLLAAFLLFSIFGFYTDLLNHGTLPYAVAFLVSVLSGFNAVLWILVVSRLPAVFIPLLIVLQFFIGPASNKGANWMMRVFHLHEVPSAQGVHFSATCILVLTIVSHFFFTTFIRTEGRRSMILQNQLELAHSIQRTLVPTLEIRMPRFELYGISQPSEKVGGDLVDAVSLENGDLIAFLADITGHGLAASILMGRVKTAARTALLDAGEREPQETIPLLLNRLNTVLPQVKESQLYATFTGFRFGADGSVFCALAASPPVVHWHASAQSISHCQEPQFPVGLLPQSHFDGFSLDAATGDLFVVATDGILEVADKHGEEFGLERLNQVVASGARDPLPQLAARILAAARSYGRQLDDQTILLVRRL
ncbi:MAG TPA: PP2C family protein-serine/threonine phosphatase [Acidobacteriaceae bacterium]|nr:PP2C family protein-serine/threonine phosphatase [Acidobacteriaceae bacterium]